MFAAVIAMALLTGQSATGAANLQNAICDGIPVPQFADITAKAGIRFEHTFDKDKRYIVESMGGGVLLLDYDRDGWLDIYFTNSPTVAMALKGEKARSALYHNNHDGTFTDATDKARVAAPCFAMGGAVADYNNDGWPDMYVTCLGGNVLYRNNGDGTFTDVAKMAGVQDGRWSTGAAFGDYDEDGLVDLVVTNYVDFRLDDLPRFGSAPNCKYRGIEVQCGPRGLKGAGDSLFHNNGDGTFTDVSKKSGVDDPNTYFGLTPQWADFNGEGRPSLFIADDATPNYLYRNEGDGHFSEIGLKAGVSVNADGSEQANMGVALGDYLHSGRPAIYSTTFSDEYKPLYRNNGNWDFTDVTNQSGIATPSLPYVGWGTAFVDLNNDGWLDLIAVNGHVYPQVDSLPSGPRYREPKYIFLNKNNGTFCNATQFAGPVITQARASRGLAVGDLLNDGQMDAVEEDIDGAPQIIRNLGAAGNHWIAFELAGTKSNRLAIGARLKVIAGGMTQTDEIHSGTSYISQNDLRPHFGLGTATKADRVEIVWPSGHVDTLMNLPSDHMYAVLENAGIVDRRRILPPLAPAKRH
jgi:enediyne biosynthesis protein E4